MAGSNPCHVPMEPCFKLSKCSTAPVTDATEYRSIVGNLRSLVHTRPDLNFAVGFVSRFMEAPTEEHLAAVKRILRYITRSTRLRYCVETKKIELEFVPTEHQLADMLTKPLGRVRLAELRSSIGMVEVSPELRPWE
ncbi:hypothetical protein QYE76_019253 [Lolium multiflorum]|uniref:Uncharacterized protein n=1 Tax=Lolium multiflorum TaxID=4521 RepID=A0AAD8R461_LOLMU|nr:hypothetical protein QYE76_019253 [Lolium multiflorum]